MYAIANGSDIKVNSFPARTTCMSTEKGASEWTSLGIRKSVHDRLAELKPYESMSYNDLLDDMADSYEADGDV